MFQIRDVKVTRDELDREGLVRAFRNDMGRARRGGPSVADELDALLAERCPALKGFDCWQVPYFAAGDLPCYREPCAVMRLEATVHGLFAGDEQVRLCLAFRYDPYGDRWRQCDAVEAPLVKAEAAA